MSKPEDWILGYSTAWRHDQDVYMVRAIAPRYIECGVACVETAILWNWNDETYTAYTEQLKRLIGAWQDGGVLVWSVHAPGGRCIDLSHPKYARAGVELIAKYMRVLAEMGVDKIVVHPSFEPISDGERESRLDVCARSLRELQRGDVKIAVENLPRSCLLNTPDEALRLFDALGDGFCACVDVNHCQRSTPERMIAALGDRLATLHISDDDGVDECHMFPGEGVLDWNGILDALSNTANYTGAFMYELKEKYADPARIRASFDALVKRYRSSRAARA